MEHLLVRLGPVCAVIGAQWGDEGKGKIVDVLAGVYDVTARACGGANAGHTIMVSGRKHVFHLLPASSLHPGKPVILGSGMVLHLPTLVEEIRALEDAGVSIRNRLWISSAAHIVLDVHKAIDAELEERRLRVKGQGIGTTKRGIGPATMDKALRTGLRASAILRSEHELKSDLADHALLIKQMFGVTMDLDAELRNFIEARESTGDRIAEIPQMLHEFRIAGKSLLIEGAQGTLLDIDHGTYPYVTSSSTTAAGALQGLGLPPKELTSVIGVAKAYCTRVGSGAFATEAPPERANRLRDRGGEYGATTGRPRRCGWLSIADLKYAALLNGITCWNITKLDVLDEEDVIPVSTGSRTGVQVYEELRGWNAPTSGITSYVALPVPAQRFIEFIETQTGIPVSLIGTGQERTAMIVR